MTRPNIVRADTIDLQDQDSPSAAEHHRPALQNGLAPHQRAEVHHVLEERSSEEHALADAWKMADDLTEEPETIDEAQQQHQNTEHPGITGAHIGHEDGAEAGSSEVEADDDMMDRISSSPSIDDGGYTLHSSPPPFTPRRMVWPERKSSLSPSPRSDTPTPTPETFNQSTSSSLDSSPFLQTPQHLPLHVRRTGKAASPLSPRADWSPSPLAASPTNLPTISVEDMDGTPFLASEHHQPAGRYEELLDLEHGYQAHWIAHDDEGSYDNQSNTFRLSMDCQSLSGQDIANETKRTAPRSKLVRKEGRRSLPPIESPFRKNAWAQSLLKIPESNLEHSGSLTSITSVDLQDVLLPIDDPLLDTPPSPSDSSGSWESLSGSDQDSLELEQIDDDTDALFNSLDDRFIDSGWGGECLRETEDIDFEFVYALHTFVATVEGQANATKGDTMVLLDDSNSYWWLVRVVKDSSIGYLPAEHIETPTERLARLNKHRNIDLSATMLSDNAEKTRNPLKRLKKRNAKAVQFAAPTYVEASDYDYDDDEDEAAAEGYTDGVQSEEAQQSGEHSEDAQAGENGVAQEEAPRATTPTRGSFDREQAATNHSTTDDPQLSPKLVDKTEAAPLKSRKTRNTDSFLKDDSVETRKITITPGLLREDQASRGGSSSGETARSDSLDDIVKQISPPEPLNKKDSKKKEEKKKEGIFKGLFKSKKKDKKVKEESESIIEEKPSTDYSPQSPVVSPLASGRNSPGQAQEPATVMSVVEDRAAETQPTPQAQDRSVEQEQEESAAAVAELEGSQAAHEMDSVGLTPIDTTLGSQEKPKTSPLSPITNLLKRDESKGDKPAKAKKAKARMELDDFDTPSEEPTNPFGEQDDESGDTDETEERLSDSPVEITPNTFMHGTESVHIPTPGPYDQPGMEDDDDDEPESMTSSPSIIEHPAEPAEEPRSAVPEDDDSTPRGPRSPSAAANEADKAETPPARGLSTDSTTSSSNHLSPATTVSHQSWSDSSLRAWLEDGSEVKDMMIMIHDKSGVVAVGEDHPLMAGLFTEQKKGVQNMMTELDGLLGSYLQRKGIAFG